MPKPLRILIGCDTFGPNVNGAAKFAERLAAGLVERGHDVRVMAPAAGRKSGTWVEVWKYIKQLLSKRKSLKA